MRRYDSNLGNAALVGFASRNFPRLDSTPNAFRRDRHFKVLHAVIAERIHDRVDDDGKRRRRSALAAAPYPEPMGGRGNLTDCSHEERQSISPRHRIIHEGG